MYCISGTEQSACAKWNPSHTLSFFPVLSIAATLLGSGFWRRKKARALLTCGKHTIRVHFHFIVLLTRWGFCSWRMARDKSVHALETWALGVCEFHPAQRGTPRQDKNTSMTVCTKGPIWEMTFDISKREIYTHIKDLLWHLAFG